MPLTRFPNGVTTCTTTALVYNTACTDSVGGFDCNNLYVNSATSIGGSVTVAGSASVTGNITATGKVTGAVGSVFGNRLNIAALGSQTVTLTSALLVTTQLIAPCSGYPEIVYLQDATAAITRSIRIVGGADSTGTASCTLTLGSGTVLANTVYTTIGTILVSQGSPFVITSAVTATVNTAYLTVNFVAASA